MKQEAFDPRSLYDRKVYILRFYHHLSRYDTHKAAYEATEAEFYDYFGSCKYTSYESFKNVKSRYINALRNARG